MSCGSKIAPLIVHLLILVLTPPWAISVAIAMDPNAQNILENLANEDYATRFDAVMRLVSSSDPQIDGLLSKAIDDGLFQGSELGSAAADFVRLKRSGKKPSRRLPSDDQAVNVFLISVDTLRADHLGCYGSERNTSPAIDRLAERTRNR